MFEKKKLNILVVGAKGQLGSCLIDFFNDCSLKAKSRIGKVFGVDKDELDICDRDAVSEFFNQHTVNPNIKFDYVINCAAATDTTVIEKDPFSYYSVNVLGAKHVAESCAYNKIKLIHISTDYVFSERSSSNSTETYFRLEPFPVNQYGLQKLLAEKFVETAYAKWPKGFMIARSSWMFGNNENSFVEKFLSNVAKKYASYVKSIDGNNDCKAISYVDVVDDCFGKPTSVLTILSYIVDIITNSVHHKQAFDCTVPDGQISRYEWAQIILDCAKELFIDSEDTSPTIVDMLKHSFVNGVNSSSFSGMKHPGKVLSLEYSSKPQYDIYKNETMKYIEKNRSRIMNLMKNSYDIEFAEEPKKQ